MSTSHLIDSLLDADLYQHLIKYFKVLETHISWVILTGDYAYKIKKPVNFGFLDYSTLEKRKFYCQEEVRLNQRLASPIYIDAIPIYGSLSQPSFQSNNSNPIEYAVKMHEFPQDALLTTVLNQRNLTAEIIDELAIILARFHLNAKPVEQANPLGEYQKICEPVMQNFTQCLPLLIEEQDRNCLSILEVWTQKQNMHLKSIFHKRKTQNFIRECHGDLHLGNIILYQNRPLIFDCIEFNPALIWIDVIADLAFLIMDLEDHDHYQFAYRLLNRYLEITGDYAGMQLICYYKTYRAMIRAKVALFRLKQADNSAEKQQIVTEYRRYLSLAEGYTKGANPALLIMHGVSRSGKSTLAKWLAERLGSILIRSDIERKRLNGIALNRQIQESPYAGIYTQQQTEATYQYLASLSQILLQAGCIVIVDATFLHYKQRQLFQGLAQELQLPFIIIACKPLAHIEKHNTDPSEAYAKIQAKQQEILEPLSELEIAQSISAANYNQVLDELSKRLRYS